ncbi:Mrx19p [Sporobolomyces salmoneus]|uniref:Mrx19p n=1 Tax=Sporobolomyces salmoneus TaxID=183962 RepID=UPI00317BA2EB
MRSTPPSLLKLFALPLSRSSVDHPPLFLLHAHRPRSTLPPTTSNNDGGERPKLPLLTKATDKAADMWAGLGRGKEGSWKKRSYDFGEKMMDKIEFEEWALKAIDTNLAPKPFKAATEGANALKASMYEPVELIYPKSLLKSEALLEQLEKQLRHREPHHRNAMWKCLILAPLTTPFALLPVIPNFPLFYVLWRAWSHWRAHKASSYLLSLLSSPSSNLSLTPSSTLDKIYSPLPPPSDDHTDSRLLLTNEQVERLTKEFGMDFEEKKELERAVGQAEERLRQGRKQEKEKDVMEKEREIVRSSIKEERKE